MNGESYTLEISFGFYKKDLFFYASCYYVCKSHANYSTVCIDALVSPLRSAEGVGSIYPQCPNKPSIGILLRVRGICKVVVVPKFDL